MISKYIIRLLLLGIVFFRASFWTRLVFRILIPSSVLASGKYLLRHLLSLLWMDMREIFKTSIHVYHSGQAFSYLIFSWMLHLVSPYVCSPRGLLRVLLILFFRVIHPISISIMFFPFPYFTQNFVDLCIQLSLIVVFSYWKFCCFCFHVIMNRIYWPLL